MFLGMQKVIPQFSSEALTLTKTWIEDTKIYGKDLAGHRHLLGEYKSIKESTAELLNLHESASQGQLYCMN